MFIGSHPGRLQRAYFSEKQDTEARGFPDWWWPVVKDASYVWGDWLPKIRAADLRVINLETSITESRVKAPGHAFNFRMHPENIEALSSAM